MIRLGTPFAGISVVLSLCLMMTMSGCGGGGSGQSSNPATSTTSPDFVLSINPTAFTLNQGGSVQVSVSVTASNGFNSAVSVQVGGLPSGVSVTPASGSVLPGAAQQLTLSAAFTAAPVSSTLTVTGTSGGRSHTAQMSLTIAAKSVPALSRTRYVRTDSSTPYGVFGFNSHWIVYNSPTNRFFVADPTGNHIYVLDAASQSRLATLDVPGAYMIDDTPDHSTLYVGTQIGDVYTIDALALQVTHRYLASGIGPNGFAAFGALVLANGGIALLGSQGGIPSVDGYAEFAIWNPTNNFIQTYASSYGLAGTGDKSAHLVCQPMGNIAGFTRTADRAKIVLTSADSDGTLCEVDPTTGTSIYTSTVEWPVEPVISGDGSYIAVPSYTNTLTNRSWAVILDAHTLQEVRRFNVGGDTSTASSFIFSADSKTLYIPGDGIIYAYDVATGQQTGWVPNLTVEPTYGGLLVGEAAHAILQAVDGTGLLAGPLEEGVGFLDAAALRTGPVGVQFLNGYLQPAFGPTSGGTNITINGGYSQINISAAYFGSQLAPSATFTSNSTLLTSPAGKSGPADVSLLMSDGGAWYMPDGFSYGPTVLQIAPNASTADGGGYSIAYGYGFGPTTATTIPSDLQVTVGGQPATILGFNGNAYGALSPPFPLEAVAFKIPPGNTGSAADVRISNASASTTARGAISYFPVPSLYVALGASLAQGLYDPYRDLYYFTDANQIQVFSRTKGSWLTPIAVPAPPPGATHRLWGIALSPDGTKLAVSDSAASVIYLLDPTGATAPRTFPVANQGSGIISHPAGLAISNTGIIYYAVSVYGGTGYHGFFKLDTNTGNSFDYGINSPGTPASDILLRVALRNDGTRAYFNNDGQVFSIDTATDKVFYEHINPGCCYGDYDLTLSSDQTRLAASGYFYDAHLNAEAYNALNDREAMNIGYLYGEKLSSDGSLLFQPTQSGIDVIDGRVGTLRSRLALSFNISNTFDALVSDGKDNIMVAIIDAHGSGNGVAVIDLSSIPEPNPLPYVINGASGRAELPMANAPIVINLHRSFTASRTRRPQMRSTMFGQLDIR